MDSPEDLLQATQDELEGVSEEVEETAGIDRREFMFMSLAAAAATTFGAHYARAQGGGGGGGGGGVIWLAPKFAALPRI